MIIVINKIKFMYYVSIIIIGYLKFDDLMCIVGQAKVYGKWWLIWTKNF